MPLDRNAHWRWSPISYAGLPHRSVDTLQPDTTLLRARTCCGRPFHDQLLHTPVQEFADPDFVLGRARDGMPPAELPEVLAGLAVYPEHLSVERHLVDAPGEQ